MFLSFLDRFLSINVLLGINTCYLVSFRGYGRLILQKYDVFNSIQFILIVFWGKAWLCLPLRSPDMNTRTGLAPRSLPVHLMTGMTPETKCIKYAFAPIAKMALTLLFLLV